MRLVGAGAATTAVLTSDIPLSHEYVLNSDVLVLDFFDVPKPSRENLLEAIPQTDEETKQLMTDYYAQQFGDHGARVLDAMEKTSGELDVNFIKRDITTASILPAVSIGEIKKDDLGNMTAVAEISDKYIDSLIARSSASIVNISFEVGKFALRGEFYSREMSDEEIERFNKLGITKMRINGRTIYKSSGGKTYTEEEYNKLRSEFATGSIVELNTADRIVRHEDGYTGKYVYENLLKLASIASNHPDKFFVAAGGNPDKDTGKRPDIRGARKRLEKEGLWAENLILIGYVGEHPYSRQIEPMQFGSDYYVDKMEASSLATAYTSELVTELVKDGAVKRSSIKAELDRISATVTVDPTDSESEVVEYKLLESGKK